jgi:hypothetical protein
MADLWARVQKTTITQHLKEVEPNIMSNQKITALLTKKGRVSYNHGGKNLDWRIKKSRNSMTGYGDMQAVNFDRVNRHEVATLDWRGYMLSEAVSKMEKLANKGKEAIVNFVSELTESMIDDIKYHFAREFYLDGNGVGRDHAIHGFLSWLGFTSNAQYTLPDDSYAGLDTDLQAYGGAVISGAWPSGKFDPEYYFWSPLIVNYSHANFGSSWAAGCIDALRNGIIFQKNSKGIQGQLDLILITAAMYAELLDQLDEKERIQVERGAKNSELISLGFKDVVNFDGVDVTYEVDTPADSGFGLNFKELELCSMQGQLFVPGKDYDIATLADRYTLDFFGNLKGNPRSTVYWKNIT